MIKKAKISLTNTSRFSRANLAIFGAVFAVIGGYLIYSSFAAGNMGGLTTANIWISPTAGGSCARSATPVAFIQATSCGGSSAQVLDMANDICRGGDLVGIKGGTYTAAQIVSGSGVSRSSSSVCTMANAQGETVTLGAAADQGVDIGVGTPTSFLTIDGSYGVSCLPGNLGTATSLPDDSCIGIFAPTYTEVSNPVRARWGGENGDSYLTFKHIAVGAFSNAGGETHFTVQYSDIGPEVDQDSCGGNNRIEGDNETWADNFIHDMVATTGTCGTGHHTECVTWDGGNNVLITRNEFKNCFTGGVFAKLVSNTTGSEVSYNAWWNPAHHSMTDDDLDISTGSGATSCGILVSHNSFSNGFETPGNCPGINNDGTNVNVSQDVQPADPRTGGASSGTANIFVATTGNSSCTRSTTVLTFSGASGHICQTPLQACQTAAAADTVIIEDGTYSGDLSSCHGHQNYASNVIMEPEPGHECPTTYPAIPGPFTDTSCKVNFSGTDLRGGNNRNCDLPANAGNPLPSTLSATQKANWINHLTIHGIYIGGFDMQCASEVRLENDIGSAFFIRQGSYNVTIDGGAYGNDTGGYVPTVGDSTVSTNGSDPGGTSFPPAENVTLQNGVYHDFTTNDPGSHGDGIFVQPSYNTKIIKNVLVRNDCIPIYVNFAVWSGIGVHGLWVIGNVVHVDTQHVASTGHCGQGISLGDNVQSDTVVAFNSLETPIRRSPSTNNTTNDQVIGNVSQGISASSGFSCVAGLSAKYNVFVDSGASNCGDSTNSLTNGTSQFVSTDTQPNSPTNSDPNFTAPLGDYRLIGGSAGLGKVPTSWCSANPGVCPSTDINGNPRPSSSHPTFYDAGAYESNSSGTSSVPGDINNDGHVNSSDLTILLANYGTNYVAADFNQNGVVDIFDLSLLVSHYGT